MNELDCLQYDPFGGGRYSSYRLLKNKMVTSRKGKGCCICFQEIKPGERIRVMAAIVEEELSHVRFCQACCEAMALSWEDDGDAIEARTEIGKMAWRDTE